MKSHCSTCKAKPKETHSYRGHDLCFDCLCEYRCMFDGWLSKNQQDELDYQVNKSIYNFRKFLRDDGIRQDT